MVEPMTQSIKKEFDSQPFLILVSCLLSLRTKDAVTLAASRRLFSWVKSPEEMVAFPEDELARLIYPVGFYRRKAAILKAVSQDIIDRFGGQVPRTEKELLSIKGVGHKTAALVLGEAFGIPALCVDTHVHRIANRLGIVKTKTPAETQRALALVIPRDLWIESNRLFAMWGQNICVPVSPRCSECAISQWCKRVGVTRSR